VENWDFLILALVPQPGRKTTPSGWEPKMLLQSNPPSVVRETINPVKAEFINHFSTSIFYGLFSDFMISFAVELHSLR